MYSTKNWNNISKISTVNGQCDVTSNFDHSGPTLNNSRPVKPKRVDAGNDRKYKGKDTHFSHLAFNLHLFQANEANTIIGPSQTCYRPISQTLTKTFQIILTFNNNHCLSQHETEILRQQHKVKPKVQ